ncbi:unnamed protein product [Linum tenue]|uniref:Microtubule-binding protein TANGLED n=1 Tax=Linum tenue TaxID=586396 RepID=A0AAV0R1Y0_9ROSI|nr:unnamed protein product [Linum tenue]
MVARTPPKQRRFMAAPPLNPLLIRETVNKVDKCMARLQELQYTVTGGNKVVASGVSLSPRSTRGYLRTSLRCKQESLRIKTSAARKSPTGKLPAAAAGEWKRMSLPAMLLGETMGEILQASQFAKQLVAAVNPPPPAIHQEDPKTPLPQQRKKPPPNSQNDTVLKSKRQKEKQHQNKLNSIRSESGSPPPSTHRRARSRSINFKVISPPRKRSDRENLTTTTHHLANRVSPRNKPWGKKTVLFPNPLFHSSNNAAATTRPRSPPIFSRTHQKSAAHKFLIKSPVKISPTKDRVGAKKKAAAAPSPTRFSGTATKLRRSFSPSRIANRLASLSPLKGGRRNNGSGGDGSMMVNGKVSGLKQRPQMMVASSFSPRRFSLGRI